MNMAIVGYGNVGKSSLGYFFAHKKFSKDIEPTEHQQYYNRTVTLQTNGSLKVKVNIADTPPFEYFVPSDLILMQLTFETFFFE